MGIFIVFAPHLTFRIYPFPPPSVPSANSISEHLPGQRNGPVDNMAKKRYYLLLLCLAAGARGEGEHCFAARNACVPATISACLLRIVSEPMLVRLRVPYQPR